MGPTKALIDALYREDVLRAQATPPEQKILAGAVLFDRSCRIMAAGIHDEFPEADEAEVQRVLRERLDLIRRLEQIP